MPMAVFLEGTCFVCFGKVTFFFYYAAKMVKNDRKQHSGILIRETSFVRLWPEK